MSRVDKRRQKRHKNKEYMAFIRNKEDFICEHCGYQVKGTGYTNHCPKCLWSKHVDIDPGDRQSECGGMMRPVDLYFRKHEWIIGQRCESCGFSRNDKIRPEDDFSAAVKLEKELVEKKMKKLR